MKGRYCVFEAFLVVLMGVSAAWAEQVVFSEIMYHPAGTLPEYIEVYNNTATVFDIAEWRLCGGVDYVFPAFTPEAAERTFLKPLEHIVLTGVDEATLRATYQVPATVRVFGPWTGNLKNGGERITLQDRNGVTVCTVEYNDRGRWSPAADGAGHSLVLKNPDRKIDDWRNWGVSLRPGGTPGTEEVQAAQTPVASPVVNLAAGIPFVNYGDVWRYNDKNTNLGTAWRGTTYDDSTWPQGPGLLGFETAALPAPGIRTGFQNSQQLTFYLRTKFTYNGSLKGVTMTIDQVLDDGAVYYLNGQEIGRSGMPSGTISFTTASNRTVGDAVEELGVIKTTGSPLVNGTNVLAVEVHQINTTSSDVVFGMRLNISAPTQASLMINEVLPGAAGIGFVEIFNPGATAVNLRNYYLTDDPANLRKFRIASDVTASAGGLAAVGYAESGLTVGSTVRVYLVAPDGQTIINAISAIMALDGRSIGRQPAGSDTWFLFSEPTRGTPNVGQSAVAAQIRLNEVHFQAAKTIDWVEFYNSGNEAISLDGLFLSASADLSDKVPLSGSVPAGGYASQNVAFPLTDGEATLFLVNGAGTVLWARVFERPTLGDCLQAFPQGSDEWYASARNTRDAANDPARTQDVVINEVMYDPPSGEPSGEFVELYNRSDATIDVSGWRFVDGLDFTIPSGRTIPAHGFLVVAADANWMRSTYGNISVVGDFTGHLSNDGEMLRLVDQWGNLADEADYHAGGNWPSLTHGGGSSMELRNPWLDNGRASAWFDSDESAKMPFQHYSYSGVYLQLNSFGGATDYKELHLHLVGDSYVILKNIQVRLNGTGPNLILAGNAMSTNGASATGWLAQGTHYASHLENGELHLISDGHGDNRPNRVEVDITGIQQGQTYEISFDARWVAGASRVIAQTWDHSIAATFSLPVPAALGTPGAANSCFRMSPVPQVDELTHSPPVPAARQTVCVTARVQSQTPAPKVLLWHRLDNTSGNGAWTSKTMFDDGVSGGDEQAGDGIYSAQLTEYGTASQVVQFYVQAVLSNGSMSQMPKEGADRPAMYVVDTPTSPGDLRRMRFVVSALDLRAISNGDTPTPPYGYAFPRLSNHYFNTTVIVNEKDIYYGCEIRAAGSPWTRGGGVTRAKFKFPDDHLFRGHSNLAYRNYDVGWWSHDRIVRYWLYLLGNPTPENEFIVVKVNSAAGSVREEIEIVGNDMLNRAYENGSQGELYKIDDEWWFTDSWQRASRNADWSYKNSDNPGRYHSEWMKRTRENEYDYSALISFFKKVYAGGYTQAEIERLVDPVALMRSCAVAGYIHAWDFFSLDRGKNCYFYRRPTDGRFMFFPWDLKRSFDSAGAEFYNGMPGFRPYLDKPYNMRLFKHYLTRLLDDYTLNSTRIYTWLQLEEDASTQFPFNFSYATWFTNRQTSAFGLLGASRTAPFGIAANNRSPVIVSGNTGTITGSAPLRVFKVQVVDHPEAQYTWQDEGTWRAAGIVLHGGTNELTVRGLDEFGTILEQTSVSVNRPGTATPALTLSLAADPPSWTVPMLEPITVSVSESPGGATIPLQYSWSVTPGDAPPVIADQNVATVAFSRPGLYTIRATGTAAGGMSAQIEREIAVYGPQGFSSFDQPKLESFWNLENVILRTNYFVGPYYSLAEVQGSLILQVWDDRAFPAATSSPQYPLVWRSVPPLTDWAFLAKVRLRGQVFGNYFAGVLAETIEAGSPVRYLFGIQNGASLGVWRITASGVVNPLQGAVWNVSEADIRIRRAGSKLNFEQRVDGVWTSRYEMPLPGNSSTTKAGMFLATDTPQSVKIAFDEAILVDPSSVAGGM